MPFEEVVDQALAMLQRRGRVIYRMLPLTQICLWRQRAASVFCGASGFVPAVLPYRPCSWWEMPRFESLLLADISR